MNIHLRFPKHCWQYPILVTLHEQARSSRAEVFCKKGVFWKFRKPKVFSCEFSEIFKNTFFHRTPPVAASEKLKTEAVVQRCSVKKVFLEILLNSQLGKHLCQSLFFTALGMQLYWNRVSETGLFLWILRTPFLGTPFYRTHPVAAPVQLY